MRKTLFAAALLSLPVLLQAQVKLLRHPTYSKGKVAFSYLGDIWTANENGSGAQRLTDNAARDQFPRFSPDGSMIAFSSNRDGNYDVFVIPSAGGKPRQLTFHTAADNVVGWTNDGKNIVFSSTRGNGAFPSVATLWEIPVSGGIETPISTDWGSSASFSQDGSKMAFSRHPGVWSRRHYRGSYAVDLWIEDIASKKFTKLGDSDYKGNYLWPMYAGNDEIYFVADILPDEKAVKFGSADVMKSVNNIYKISDKSGKPVQVTHHGDGNLYFPSISADGKTIVYEDNFGIWKLDVASGKSSEIRVEIKSDAKENDTELVTLTNDAEGFNVSPSNKRAAIAVHGEIFTIATDRGETQRVTDTPWREEDPRWSPNGKFIAYVSDRTGRQEVYTSDELGKNVKQLSNFDCDKSGIVWAPDSKSFVYSGSDHKLRRVDVESGKTDELVTATGGNVGGAQFSPDGAFLAYSKPDHLLRQHVFIKELATGQEHQIGGGDFLSSTGAKWTADGRKLLFLGGVSVAAIASTGGRGTSQLYSASLLPAEKDPNSSDVDTEAQAEAADNVAGRGARGAVNGAPNVQVKIVWDGLDRRVTQLTRMPGSVSAVIPAPDSRSYLFIATGGASEEGNGPGAGAGPAYYTIADDGARLTRLNTTPTDAAAGRGRGGRGAGGGGGAGGNEAQWSRDGRSIYFLQGGSLYSLAVGGGGDTAGANGANAAAAGRGGRGGGGGGRGGAAAPTATASTGAAPRRIDFSLRMVIDIPAERRQIFEEAWRTMKNRYYDAKMHGADWAAAKDKYESLLGNIADIEELQNVIMEMIGEINSSHTGISGGTRLPGDQARPDRITTRYPGFDMQADSSGYYKVSYIYRKGPADHEYVKIAPGNFILAVNGEELKTSENYWKLFNIMPEKKFEFVVNSKPSMDGSWTVTLDPLTSAQQNDLEYARWVDDRAASVNSVSKGEIGYLHIKAMDAPSLAKFQRDLLENMDKKALIIDERFNGGGGIDMELLEILNQRKPYQTTRGRDSIDVRRPAQAFFGPMV
ncbi:MAG TPA: S41 family peptidase, partial [Bryobacteraceae bacterium]|nr:S41 family peptidase [Bryobacteraceae bacterium]